MTKPAFNSTKKGRLETQFPGGLILEKLGFCRLTNRGFTVCKAYRPVLFVEKIDRYSQVKYNFVLISRLSVDINCKRR